LLLKMYKGQRRGAKNVQKIEKRAVVVVAIE
jgi:hypothetical protein